MWRALEGHGRKVPVSNPGRGSESWIEGTVQLNSPHPEPLVARPLSFFFSPRCILETHILALPLPLFIVWGLGNKAWFLSTQTDPAWRGQDGTTSFSTSAPSQSVESCFYIRSGISCQVSGLETFLQPSPRLFPQGSSRPHPLPGSYWGWVGPLWEMGWDGSLPPPEGSPCLCVGGGGVTLQPPRPPPPTPMRLSLPRGHRADMADGPGFQAVSCHLDLRFCTFQSPAWCWCPLPLLPPPPPNSWESRVGA